MPERLVDAGVDAVADGARIRRLDSDFRWPGGQNVAVVCNLAFEAWSAGRAPGVGPMGNPLPPGGFDTNAMSWGHYGVSRGIDRLLRVLADTGIRASVMVSGILAERAPHTVKAIADGGHEIVAHSYAQDVLPTLLSDDEDRDNITRTTEALARAAGVRPVGWMSPRGTPGRGTARRLAEAGYLWQGDAFDDDRPYLEMFEHGSLVAVPFAMELNDLPHAMRFGRTPRQFIDNFDDAVTAALDDRGGAVIIDVTAHAHCYGRPAGAWAFGTVLQRIAGQAGVWSATRREIAQYVKDTIH